MAGGGGTRFWPASRDSVPKQFLNLTGKDLMINETIDRFNGIVAKEHIYVVTNRKHKEYTKEVTKGRLEDSQILGEPAARNTAACIGYAAMKIVKEYGDGIMCIVPSDHNIANVEAYKEVIQDGIFLVKEKECLVTIGITPTYPATGYGYIKSKNDTPREVVEFVEKPDLETAKEYIKTGNYAWNSGMFIWKASTILEYFKTLLPDIYVCLETIGNAMNTEAEDEVLQEVYPTIPKISIDYGIMERAKGIYMLEGNFGWSDVGSWDALESLYEKDEFGNIITKKGLAIHTKNSILYGESKLIATIGLEDMIVVESGNAILVCRKEDAQNVKDIVELLKAQEESEYL